MKGKNNVVTILSKRIRQNQTSRAEAGNAEGTFEVHFEQYWASVCRTVYRILGDMDEAEDIALDVFWKLYTQPPGQHVPVSAWLHRVAVNLGLNALRTQQRRQAYELQGYLPAIQEQPESAAIREEARARVRQVLSEMKPRAAKLLVLRHSGLTYAEIAAALQLNPRSIGTWLSRAEREFEKRYRSLEEHDVSPK